MGFNAKDSIDNIYEVRFSSYWSKDIKPITDSSTYPSRYGVEPFGVKTNFNVPFRYVTNDDTAGKQTAYINKDLYYYNQLSGITFSIPSYYTNYYNLSPRAIYDDTNGNSLKSQVISYTYTNSNPSYTFQNTFSFSLIQDDMPQLFDTNTSTHFTYWTPNTVSNWFSGSNWYLKWVEGSWSFDKAENCVTSSSCPTVTKTYTQPFVSGGSNIDVDTLYLKIYLSYFELPFGDYATYMTTTNTLNFASLKKYTNINGTKSVVLTKSSPSNTVTLTPTFNIEGYVFTIKDPITINVQLSGTNLVVTITQPYGFTTLSGLEGWVCGLMETFEVVSGKISMLSSSSPISLADVSFQYNSNLHPCYFWSPTEEVAYPKGVLDCYSYYFPSSSYYYAMIPNSGCPVIIWSPNYTLKSGQSASQLQDGTYLTDSSLSKVYADSAVKYVNVFAGKANYTEYYNYLLTDDGYNYMLSLYGNDENCYVGEGSSKTAAGRFKTGGNMASLKLYSSDQSTLINSMPITCYYIEYYPLRKDGDYLYNDSGRTQSITIDSFYLSTYPQSYTNAFYCNNTFNTSGTVNISGNSSGYLFVYGSNLVFYSDYRSSQSTTATMNYTYCGKSYSLTKTYTYYLPTACIGYRFYYNTAYLSSASVATGSNTNYGSSCSITSTSSYHSSISYTNVSGATAYSGTTYFKISCTPSRPSGCGRYNYQLKVYYAKYYLNGSGGTSTSSWSTGTGTSLNPYYSSDSLTFADYWFANTNQNTYTFVAEVTRTEISYPTITNCADNGSYKRKITVKNPNSYSVYVYYTSNKCTSSSSIDSGATWSYGGYISGGGTGTFYVTDRSGWSDAYIAVGISCGGSYYCVSWYSESVSSSPTKYSSSYIYHS